MKKTVLVVCKPGKEADARLQVDVADHRFNIEIQSSLYAEKFSYPDLVGVIAYGGDGTLLTAARIAFKYAVKVVGINKGTLGFMANYVPKGEYSLNNAACLFFEEYSNEASPCRVSLRCMVEFFQGDTKIGSALNEFAVGSEFADKYLEYELYIETGCGGKVYAGTHKSNALFISTPSGSTAYALSTGGALIDPNGTKSLQITSLAPFSMTSRPIVLSPAVSAQDATLFVKVKASKEHPLTVKGDGQIVHNMTENSTLTFKTGGFLQMLEPLDSCWYDYLVEKLHWGTPGGRLH